MPEEVVALERLDDRGDPVVPADAKVVALRDVVSQDDPRVLPDPAEHRQEHVAFEGLRLVHDDESIVERPAPDVGERQDLEKPAVDDLVEDVLRDDRAERVEDRLGPGIHLLGGIPGEVAEILAAHGVERAEDHDAAVLLPLENGLESCAEGKSRLARSCPSAEGDDAEIRVEKHVDGEALFGRTAMKAEDVPIPAHEAKSAGAGDPAERRASLRVDDEPGIDGDVRDERSAQGLLVVEPGHVLRAEVDLGHAGPA